MPVADGFFARALLGERFYRQGVFNQSFFHGSTLIYDTKGVSRFPVSRLGSCDAAVVLHAYQKVAQIPTGAVSQTDDCLHQFVIGNSALFLTLELSGEGLSIG